MPPIPVTLFKGNFCSAGFAVKEWKAKPRQNVEANASRRKIDLFMAVVLMVEK
jgi:hypothetical protein